MTLLVPIAVRVAWLLQIAVSPNRHEIHVPEEEKLL